ncbi:hypothetical protein [Bacillus toyonensis]|uniref:hypothetical protein n=1 Tax=Bacillus toyonensis TaxID=155322 RepID=UPI000BF64DAC|nr:hypothetical protein [Bacillus toyonensis]PFY49121.1 hypothetical protein COL55_13525 [Bacillus toyonensis]PFY86044.1 hypothetical protein COL62_02290 [Bacillus toyonensis]PHD51869.1 hypothetical protein COF75_07515 [Bacillus toyonensis]
MSNNVIKRRHTSEYAQIHNKPLQDDLEDLREIGLLSHMMSRPAEWVFHKTQLHKQFSRKNVDAAWKGLVSKRYIIGFYCHKDGQKSYYYNVSDLPFTEEEYYKFVKAEISELTEKGHSIKHVNPIPGLTLDTTEFSSDVPTVQQTAEVCSESGAPREQLSGNSSKGANINKELINTDSKTNIKTLNNIKIDDDKANSVTPAEQNSKSIELIIQSLREETKDLLIKRSFDTVVRKVIRKHKRGEIKIGFREYLEGALDTKIEELEGRRIKEQAKEVLARTSQSRASEEYTGNVLWFNFLDQSEGDKPLKK